MVSCRKKVFSALSLLLCLVLMTGLFCGCDAFVFDAQAQYYADIVVKDYGTITVELNSKVAPISVERFVTLAASGFYDGLTFHRIISGFMIQGGKSDVAMDPIKGEFTANGVENNLSHTRGAIAMARPSNPDGASTQFYIVHEDCPEIDGQYAVFGYATSGMEVVDQICEKVVPTDDNGTTPEDQQPVISTITVYTK